MRKIYFFTLFLFLQFAAFSQPLNRRASYDISKERVLYTVGYTHLDSEYEWDYRTTVSEYLKNTMEENYRLLDKYPDYVFNFTGSRRYRLMKEYHPELFARRGINVPGILMDLAFQSRMSAVCFGFAS